MHIVKTDFSNSSRELNEYLLKRPSELHKLTPRKFEEHIAYLLEKLGYEITLTQESHDKGVDIWALQKSEIGNIMTIVDCKKYSIDNPVGIGIIRNLYGTLNIEKASHAIVATTSYFTKGAKDFEKSFQFQISLKDQSDILKWMERVSAERIEKNK